MEEHIDRYKLVRQGFWWKVKIGDGQQTIGRCYTETEAMRLAADLQRAFCDGYYLGSIKKEEEINRLKTELEDAWLEYGRATNLNCALNN